MKKPMESRFWPKVQKTDTCWIWIGALGHRGYGRFNVNNRSRLAHRISFEIATGAPAPSELQVCHRCDNPRCVRPDHLFLGTNLDNVRDMQAKGRVSHAPRLQGETHHRAKLTDARVLEIREARAAGRKVMDLAAELSMSVSAISRICRGANWSHLKGNP